MCLTGTPTYFTYKPMSRLLGSRLFVLTKSHVMGGYCRDFGVAVAGREVLVLSVLDIVLDDVPGVGAV